MVTTIPWGSSYSPVAIGWTARDYYNNLRIVTGFASSGAGTPGAEQAATANKTVITFDGPFAILNVPEPQVFTLTASALFSGNYNDLTNKPTIPTSFSSLVNGAHTLSLGSTGSLTLPTAGKIVNGTIAAVGDTRIIATNSSGGVTPTNPEFVEVAYSATILSTYSAGDTITLNNGNVRTITSVASGGGGGYITIAWTGPSNSNPAYPLTLATSDYEAARPNEWTFGADSTLTFPNNTVQTTAYAPVTGQWTVTTGTNTYSFTVPMDGTYTMWVKGNIPNGIITWNATVSISNTNVPAIGTQYAWNYTGGGSPISLTSIPNQIRGTAGTISTDATYAGTTSNRFDFGISNTSGASRTVYYGYTKV
jgi:hypothetical protein